MSHCLPCLLYSSGCCSVDFWTPVFPQPGKPNIDKIVGYFQDEKEILHLGRVLEPARSQGEDKQYSVAKQHFSNHHNERNWLQFWLVTLFLLEMEWQGNLLLVLEKNQWTSILLACCVFLREPIWRFQVVLHLLMPEIQTKLFFQRFVGACLILILMLINLFVHKFSSAEILGVPSCTLCRLKAENLSFFPWSGCLQGQTHQENFFTVNHFWATLAPKVEGGG